MQFSMRQYTARGQHSHQPSTLLPMSIMDYRRASRWSAERTISQHAPFSWSLVKGLGDDEPLLFTGEMVYIMLISV